MTGTPHRHAIALLFAPALALGAAGVAAQTPQDTQPQQQRQPTPAQQATQGGQPLHLQPADGSRDAERLYRNGWSADEMLGAEVRADNGREIGEVKDILVGRDGRISRVVVEVGGFFELGDQHIGVPWKDLQIGPDMSFVQVPLREVEDGTYSLYGHVKQGEDVAVQRGEWRINELIGDYAALQDMPRYGLISDAVFDDRGQLQRLIVTRRAGLWGNAGWYGYPFYGYQTGPYAYYGLPYRSVDVGEQGRFSYAELARQSRFAGSDRGELRHAAEQRDAAQRNAAARDAQRDAVRPDTETATTTAPRDAAEQRAETTPPRRDAQQKSDDVTQRDAAREAVRDAAD